MGKVLDFFSRRQPTSEDWSDAVSEKGRYIGCLPKQPATQIYGAVQELNRRKAQIDAMIEQYNDFYEGYAHLVADALLFLKVEPEDVDTENDEFVVDESGNCWLVSRKNI